jgi:hypothetical protein
MRFPGFVGGSYQMRSITIDCQRCINLYADIDEMGTAKEGEIGALLGTPGTQTLLTLPASPVRGVYTEPGTGRAFAVAGNAFYEIVNSSGSYSYALLGNLKTSNGTVAMADNGQTICIVDGDNGYYYNFKEFNLQSFYLFTVPSGTTTAIGSVYSNNANAFTVMDLVESTFTMTVASANATNGAVYKDANNGNYFTVMTTVSGSTSLILFGNNAPTLTYHFAVSSASVVAGAIYIDSANHQFTIAKTLTGATIISAYGPTAPASFGAISLTKTYGSGDNSLTVSSSALIGGSLSLYAATTESGDVNDATITTSAYVASYAVFCSANGDPTSGATTLTLTSGEGDSSISVTGSFAATAVPWLPNYAYAVDQVIVPQPGGYQYRCTQAGTSGATVPTFPTTRYATVNDGGAIWERVSTFQAITDPGFLGSHVVAYQDGYFFFAKPDSNQVYCSNVDAITFNALDFLNLSGSSAPILNMVSMHRNLYIQTSRTTEVYYDAGVSPGFPFARINGGYLEQGLAAQFSLCQTANAMFWLGQDKSGKGIVYATATFLPERISTFAIEEEFDTYSTISDAVGYTYQELGHQFYVLSFPTAQKTWVFDISTKLWHERAYNSNGNLIMQPGIYHAFAFGIHILGDYSSGNIYQMSQEIYTDDGTPILRKRVAPHVAKDMLRIFYQSLQLDIQQGDGLDGIQQGTNPLCMMRFSDDGGRNWSNISQVSFGKIGQTKTRAIFRRLGQARDRVFEITISDPVFVAITGAELTLEVGRS